MRRIAVCGERRQSAILYRYQGEPLAFNLIPKEEKFFELFEAQAAHGVAAAKILRDLSLKWTQDNEPFDRLRDIEHEADLACHDIYDKLNRTFVTPFDREDIRDLASDL